MNHDLVVHGTRCPPPQAGVSAVTQRHTLTVPGVVTLPPQAKPFRVQMRPIPVNLTPQGGMGLGS